MHALLKLLIIHENYKFMDFFISSIKVKPCLFTEFLSFENTRSSKMLSPLNKVVEVWDSWRRDMFEAKNQSQATMHTDVQGLVKSETRLSIRAYKNLMAIIPDRHHLPNVPITSSYHKSCDDNRIHYTLWKILHTEGVSLLSY